MSFLKICVMWEAFLCPFLMLSIRLIMPLPGGNPKLHWKYFNGPERKLLQIFTEKISEYLILLLFGIKQFLQLTPEKKSHFSAVVLDTVYITAVMQESLHSGHELIFWLSASLSAISRITAIYPHNARQLFRRGKKILVLNRRNKSDGLSEASYTCFGLISLLSL